MLKIFCLVLLIITKECLGKRVVIIGGGMSGLAAAYELINKGLTEITVIEAQSYLGGRINTVQVQSAGSSMVLERGAQWIHGKINNPVFDFFNPLGFVDEKTKTISGGSTLYATPDSSIIDETIADSIKEEIYDIYDTIAQKIEKLTKDISFFALFNQEYEKLEFDDTDLSRALYENILMEERINTACQNLSELSAIGWDSYIELEGDNMINLKYGYKRLTDYLASFIDPNKIKLNEQVTKIDWSQVRSVVTTNVSTYTADYVIVTLPLGVLKATQQSMFTPPLPTDKVNAINRLGFGTVNKFFFIFNTSFFTNNEQGFEIVWKKGLSISLTSLTQCNIATSQFYKTFNSFEVHPVYKNVLYSFLYGDDAIFSENLTDQCIIDIVHELLSKVYPSIQLPKIVSLFRSKWNSNANVRGSYSFIKFGSSTDDIEELSTSLSSKIFWAGEATSVDYYSSVHGAFQSGLREARKILKSNANSSKISPIKLMFSFFFTLCFICNLENLWG